MNEAYRDVAFLRKAMLPRIQAMKPKTKRAKERDMEARQRSKMSWRQLRAMALFQRGRRRKKKKEERRRKTKKKKTVKI
jgi:hypothetical protein